MTPEGVAGGSKRRKGFCDACDSKVKGGWRCTDGCDYTLCDALLEPGCLSNLQLECIQARRSRVPVV